MNPDSLLNAVLYLLALWFIVFPVITLLHEGGHALAALRLTSQPVSIVLGTRHRSMMRQWGRLHVCASLGSGFVGFTRYDMQPLTRRQLLWITLSGPAVSLLLAVLLWALASLVQEPPWLKLALTTLSYAAAAQLLFTLLPVRYPRWLPGYGGKTSDGWRALELARRKSAPA